MRLTADYDGGQFIEGIGRTLAARPTAAVHGYVLTSQFNGIGLEYSRWVDGRAGECADTLLAAVFCLPGRSGICV